MLIHDDPQPDLGLAALVTEHLADWEALGRRWPLTWSLRALDRKERLIRDWEERIRLISPSGLSPQGKLDRRLFLNYSARRLAEMARRKEEAKRLADLLPFAAEAAALEEERMDGAQVRPEEAAQRLDRLAALLAEAGPPEEDALALAWTEEARDALDKWAAFYLGYDPTLDWWIREPLRRATDLLHDRVERAKAAESTTIPGRPLGREALLEDLRHEMIASSPEELIAIGEREYAWCLERMKEASAELGFGEDWKAALEHVKETKVPPGRQPEMVRGLALEAIEVVRDLVTVPPLAEEVWRMEMMTPAQQKVSPFFLGGEAIIVSYPTDGMTQEEKLMSMRGNNPNFSRATVQHELIPGHHLQMFMTQRSMSHRRLFSTPFWIEGWTIYWELLLWERGFPRTPEERIGMLFWRMHRCVRIVFSLQFHLGQVSTQDCVEMLVERVGHERLNAEGEVRRSFNGAYPPLYQAAYMLGGLQFWAIAKELLAEGWTLKEIHDRILLLNEMPPALMRLALLGQDPPEGDWPLWRFEAPNGA